MNLEHMKPFSPLVYENIFQHMLRIIFSLAHRVLRGLANNLLHKDVIRPREFSNAILRYYAPLFRGRIINVSGWKDGDFEEGTYATYFTKADEYLVSNAPTSSKGIGSLPNEIAIDLAKPIAPELHAQFDVVFNHTTLEHIFELDVAFANLCTLSRDVVILVVPTLQHIHFNAGYGDYNRLTPMGIVKHFEKNGFETLVLQSNEQQFSPLYCFAIAVRKESRYIGLIEKSLDFSMGGALYGSKIRKEHLSTHVNV